MMRLQLHSGEETKAEGPLRGVLLKKGASRHVRRGMWVGRVRTRKEAHGGQASAVSTCGRQGVGVGKDRRGRHSQAVAASFLMAPRERLLIAG